MVGGDIQELNCDLLTRILQLLDGPSLAAAACSSSHLRAVACSRHLWQELCLATWPSLRHLPPQNSPSVFFSDASCFPTSASRRDSGQPPEAIISAVDLFHEGKPVWSEAVRTDARGWWFGCSPFRVDAVGPAAEPISSEQLSLSWVLIEPVSGRAVNLSSQRPVEIERRWYTGDILVRFAVVLDEGRAAAVVTATLAEETMELRELRLEIEDEEGLPLNGRDSLTVLTKALVGERRRGAAAAEEIRKEYMEFARRAAVTKERRIEGGSTIIRRIAAASAVGLLAFFVLL